jgi:two-component system osmolarity sensor histidine kinase EnvZ
VKWWPRSLFGRTAVLIASTLLVFSIVAWQAMILTVVLPAAQLTVHVLTQRAQAAVAARRTGQAMPLETRFESQGPASAAPRFRGFAYGAYVETIRQDLATALHSSDVRINRLAAPSEIWVKLPDGSNDWLVLSWRLAGPKAPLAALGVLAVGALIVLGGAALSARRLTAPLAVLAAAAARVAEGERVDIAATRGPSEVRSLALAFQAMSHRLAELDEQRELMLGGISHDLRTPLARLRVAVELLDTKDAALIAEMNSSVDEMDRMIGQFLQYVRANYRERPTEASLDELVRSTLRTTGSADLVHLSLNAAENRCFAVECMRHSVLNLVQNAFEYGAPPISIRTAMSDQEIELCVSDAGAGLSQGAWLDALRPFHRLQHQPSKGHTGLGLALVDRLVRTGGGGLEMAQSGEFAITVRLPAARPSRPAHEAS